MFSWAAKKADKANQLLQKSIEAERNFQRLPKNITPHNYTICIKPNYDDFTFEGSEVVNLTLLANTKSIVLNSLDLVITKVMWEEDVTENRQEPVEIQNDADNAILKINFDPFLVPSEGTLRLNFKGKIYDKKMAGLYRSKYFTETGEGPKYVLITQFDPTDARRCFPCWDEPDVKATFDIILIVPKGKTVLSNMPEKVTYAHKKNPDLEIVEFKRTPLMSTYLVAFIIGEFDHIESQLQDGVLCRVFTPPGKKNEGTFALDIACKILPYYKKYCGFAYPLPKLDLVAVSDMAKGATENWGLIIYREVNLLVNKETAAATDRQYISLTIGEEISHQWLGNLVTMQWWTHLWLKEGFAGFCRFICVDYIFPDFDIWTQFVPDILLQALKLDSLKTSRPVEAEVYNPLEIEEMYDDIVFKKGAALFRMLHRYIGDAHFRSGINRFFSKYKYSNATTQDLWKCMETVSSKPIEAIMSTWTKQKGFPLIKVSPKQDGKNRLLRLTQEKFWSDPSARDSRGWSKDFLWMVPLTICTGNNPQMVVKEILMDSKVLTISLNNLAKQQWIKLNPGTVGFYRVRYPPEMLTQLLGAIRHKNMSALDRLGLLDDLFALVQSGIGVTVEVLSLLEAFAEEDNFSVWKVISNVFDKLIKVFAYTENGEKLKAFGRFIYTIIYEKLGWDAKPNEKHMHTLLRGLVLRQMTKFGHTVVIQEARERWSLHRTGEIILPGDLRYTVYNAVLATCTEEHFTRFLKVYREADTTEEKDRIANSLGSIKDLPFLKLVLEFSITEDVRKQDTVYMLVSASKNREGRDMTWNFFKENWQTFRSRYGVNLLGRLIKGVTEDFASEEKATEVTDFFREHVLLGTERPVSQAIESIRINDAWLKREHSNNLLRDFLESFV